MAELTDEQNAKLKAMDEAAHEAENELSELIGVSKMGSECMDMLAGWYRKWVGKAGHKRLGRIVMSDDK